MPDSKGIEVRLFEKDKVVFDKELGSGKFGKVYLATIKDTNLPQVAIKVFRKDLKHGQFSQKDKENAYEELLKLAVIHHENVVRLHGMIQSELPWLVFEYMKDGNLLEYVTKTDNIKEKTLVRFCRDICNGMAFLHNHQVLHKDLAARNILLSGKTAKIADLGLSSFLTIDDSGIYALNGKLFPYRHAPVECIVEQVYTFESDVWSFGILMYEIFTGGMTPYGKDNKEPEVRRFIVDHITPIHLLEPLCSTKIYSIMKAILNPVLHERPTFPQLLQKFQKLLHEKSTPDQNVNDENTSAAFSAFHQIKASGLASSFSNLHASPSSSSTNVASTSPPQNQSQLQFQPFRDFLTVGQNHNLKSHSTSTPDLLNATLAQPGSGPRNQRKYLPNQLTVRQPISMKKRHSINMGDVESPPAQSSSLKDDTPLAYYQPENDFMHEEEPRRRANSGSRERMNPLLQGFVQNRFTRRKS